MKLDLSDSNVKTLPVPAKGWTITRDKQVPGFGVRTTSTGTHAWVLDYSFGGRRRLYTLALTTEMKCAAARAMAKEYRRRIRHEGFDPAAQQAEARAMLMVDEALPQHLEEALAEDLIGEATMKDYQRAAKLDVYPVMGKSKLDAVTTADVSKLFRRITSRGRKRRANYVVALVRAMFNRAIDKWKLRLPDGNPCTGVTKHPEHRRDDRHLLPQQVQALHAAIAAHADRQAMAIIRLLLESGARRSEISGAKWVEIDYATNELAKPKPKQKKPHRISLSPQAMLIVRDLRRQADAELIRVGREIPKAADQDERQRLEQWRERVGTYLFPAATGATGHRLEIRDQWHDVCVAAGIVVTERVQGKNGKAREVVRHSKRLHDLRHTVGFAAVNNSVDIYTLQKMLGHASVMTTSRYANVSTETKAAGAARVSAALNGGAKIIPMRKRR